MVFGGLDTRFGVLWGTFYAKLYSAPIERTFGIHVLGEFLYDPRGPCHVWKPKTGQKRIIAEKKLNVTNVELEPILKKKRVGIKYEHGMIRITRHKRIKLRVEMGVGVINTTYILFPEFTLFSNQCKV